jgi:hypothetical protein
LLREVNELQASLDFYEQGLAYEALQLGYGWKEVAQATGTNKQTAHRRLRFADADRDRWEREWMKRGGND